MGKMFNIDSPFMQTLSTIADLMILNLLIVIFSMPIITIGPALTAGHYVALKMVRNEENYIVKGFWKSFKENFRQGIVIGLMVFAIVAILAADYYLIFVTDLDLHFIIVALILVTGIAGMFGIMYVFPVLAKFDNSILATIKNAFLFSLMIFPKSIVMIFVYLLPVAVTLASWQIFPLVMLLGISVPIFLSAMLYNKIFLKFEKLVAENGELPEGVVEEVDAEIVDEEDKIFHDDIQE